MLAQKKMPDGKKEELSQVLFYFLFNENKNVYIESWSHDFATTDNSWLSSTLN